MLEMTPYEAVYGIKPDVSGFRVFGWCAIVHIPKAERKGKTAERSEEGLPVGYYSGDGYLIFLPDSGKVII